MYGLLASLRFVFFSLFRFVVARLGFIFFVFHISFSVTGYGHTTGTAALRSFDVLSEPLTNVETIM